MIKKIFVYKDKIGLDINLQNNVGDDALITAVKSNRYNIIKLLIDNNVKIDNKNNYGLTAFDIALKKQYLSIINLLKDNGAVINKNLIKNNFYDLLNNKIVFDLLLDKPEDEKYINLLFQYAKKKHYDITQMQHYSNKRYIGGIASVVLSNLLVLPVGISFTITGPNLYKKGYLRAGALLSFYGLISLIGYLPLLISGAVSAYRFHNIKNILTKVVVFYNPMYLKKVSGYVCLSFLDYFLSRVFRKTLVEFKTDFCINALIDKTIN